MKDLLISIALALFVGLLCAFVLSGCSFGSQPVVDFAPLCSSLRFVGVCSVACSLIWGIAIIVSAKNRNKRF